MYVGVCVVLCSAVLCHVVLCCAVLCCVVLRCVVLRWVVLRCISHIASPYDVALSPLPVWLQHHCMLQPVRQAMATTLECSATEPLAISPSADFGGIIVFAAVGGWPFGGFPLLRPTVGG